MSYEVPEGVVAEAAYRYLDERFAEHFKEKHLQEDFSQAAERIAKQATERFPKKG